MNSQHDEWRKGVPRKIEELGRKLAAANTEKELISHTIEHARQTIGELKQHIAEVEQAYHLACVVLDEVGGECPLDEYVFQLPRCEDNCQNNCDGECWREYFLIKAREEAVDEETS